VAMVDGIGACRRPMSVSIVLVSFSSIHYVWGLQAYLYFLPESQYNSKSGRHRNAKLETSEREHPLCRLVSKNCG